MRLSRVLLLFLALVWLAGVLPASAATLPTVRTNYVLVAKGDTYSVNPNTGVLTPAGTFQQKIGRLAVVPRINAPTNNGANARDLALQVDRGLAGGRGAFQLVTNTFLNGLLGGKAKSPGADLAVVTQDANSTVLTVALDPQMALQTGRNLMKITNEAGNVYRILGGRLTIYFLAGNRVSGEVLLQAQGFNQPQQVALSGRFSGKKTAKW